MRAATALLGLTALLLAGLPVAEARARQPEDGDDDDNAEDDATQIADQVEAEDAGPAPPSALQQLPAAPAEQTPAAAPEKSQPLATPLGMPGKVGLPTGLNGFGHHAKAPATTKPVNMAASLNRFGKDEPKKAPTKEAQAAADAQNAHIAAETAKQAAKVADRVATHTVHVTEQAKSALKNAHDALHKARVESNGLSKSQRHALKDAERKLKEATRASDARKAKAKKQAEEAEAKRRREMKEKMERLKREAQKKRDDELEAMRKEIEDLRKQLQEKDEDAADSDAMLKDLQDQIAEMEKAEKKEDKKDQKHHDEMKAEIERLRQQIKDLDEKKSTVTQTIPKAPEPAEEKEEEKAEEDVEKYKVHMKPLAPSEDESDEHEHAGGEATPVEQKGIDIDTAMPYGELEPFGREDTAQELTENSIKESDEMVDQLERAEVAEEKRSVFRALTRLRGAAITSFDGVARSQTGNIDEYNKINKWRNAHPLHHLADEESDISKWAFPDNAD